MLMVALFAGSGWFALQNNSANALIYTGDQLTYEESVSTIQKPRYANTPDAISAYPSVLAPPKSSSFPGPDYITNIALSGGYMFIPPDPIGAAGPNHLVCVVNVVIEWFTKAGVQQYSQLLQTFFAPLSPVNFLFDPKVIYDQHADRFIVVALEQQDVGDGDPADTSRILLAVSNTSDPNGVWYFHAVDSKINIEGSNCWADYPGFAVDEDAVYVTCNMFEFSSQPNQYGVKLWIVDKGLGGGGFYEGGAVGVTVHDPWAAVGGYNVTTQPAHIFGDPGGSIGTWLVGYSGLTTGTDELVEIVQVDNPVGSVSFINFQYVNVGDIDNTTVSPLPDAPQLDSSKLDIEVNDRRALNAVWRDDSLWVSTTISPIVGPDIGQTAAHWFNFDTTIPSTITVTDQGNIGGEDIASDTYTFFPSVIVDKYGNMAIGFAACGPAINAGAYYTGRNASDPAGTVQPTGTLSAGVAGYQRRFSGSRNRWGDYTGIALDPSDEITFWVFNQYAMTPGNGTSPENGRWATQWGAFIISDTTKPEIQNINAQPNPQTSGGFLNITCDVTDDGGVDTVKVNITYPDSSKVNITMSSGSYYHNNTYTQSGIYYYYIWANDTTGNQNTSSVHAFTIGYPPYPQRQCWRWHRYPN